MASRPPQPVELLFSYAHEDEGLRDELGKHLKALEDEGVVRAWHDRDIVAGRKWDEEIDAQDAGDIEDFEAERGYFRRAGRLCGAR